MIELSNTHYTIGRFKVNCKELTVSNGPDKIKLPVKVFELLKLFIKNKDNSVSSCDAIDIVWKGNQGVGKKGYTNAMWHLRKTFTDLGADNEEVFRTLHKIGYALIIKPEVIHLNGKKFGSQVVNFDKFSRSNILFKCFNLYETLGFAIFISVITFCYFVLIESDTHESKIQVDEKKYEIKKVTDFRGKEEQPAISHNGRYLAYIALKQDNNQIHILDLQKNKNTIRTFTKGEAIKSSPAWSPNDDYLAYFWMARDGECQVRVKSIVTNKIDIIDNGCVIENGRRSLTWSESGKYLLYPKRVNNNSALFTIRVKDKLLRQVTFPQDAENDSLGLFGERDNDILFVREIRSNTQLILAKNHNEIRKLITVPNKIINLTWHFSSQDVYLTMAANKVKTKKYNLLNQSFEYVDFLGTSPSNIIAQSSNRMFFATNKAKEHIFQRSLNDDRMIRRVYSTNRNFYGQYVPESADTLFVSDRSGEKELWLQTVYDSYNLTEGLGRVLKAAVSLDSRHFVVNLKSNQNNQYQLWIGHLPKGSLTLIDTEGLIPKSPTWSRDGQSIYFASKSKERSGLFRFKLATGVIEQLSNTDEIYAVEGNNGLLYVTREGDKGIWQLNLENNEYNKIIYDLEQDDFGSYFWEGDSLYYLSRNKHDDTIMKYQNGSSDTIKATFPAGSVKKYFGISAADFESFLVSHNFRDDNNVYSVKLHSSTDE